MSQVYSTEPQTTGRVVLQTSHGPIDINLWCKECPKACRSFLQLAMDGYYNGLPFHRVIKNYLLQTGDRVSTVVDDPSVRSKVTSYLHNVCHNINEPKGLTSSYRPELSSRIKFNHRGQVAMAQNITPSGGADGEEGSSHLDGQFFITLDEASHLNGQHVIFGTIIGPTVFNAIRASGVELVEGEDTPVDASTTCFVERIEIKDHLFGDQIQPTRGVLPWVEALERHRKDKSETDILAKRKKARKGKRDLNVLSFGNEEHDADAILIHNERKSLFDVEKSVGTRIDMTGKEKGSPLSIIYEKEEKDIIQVANLKATALPESTDIGSENRTAANLALRTNSNEEKDTELTIPMEKKFQEPPDEDMKPSGFGHQRIQHSKKSSISIVEERREKYKKLQKVTVDKKGKRQREEDTIQRLLDFKSKLSEANQKASNGVVDQTVSESEGTGKEKILFDRLTADDYIVIDIQSRREGNKGKGFQAHSRQSR